MPHPLCMDEVRAFVVLNIGNGKSRATFGLRSLLLEMFVSGNAPRISAHKRTLLLGSKCRKLSKAAVTSTSESATPAPRVNIYFHAFQNVSNSFFEVAREKHFQTRSWIWRSKASGLKSHFFLLFVLTLMVLLRYLEQPHDETPRSFHKESSKCVIRYPIACSMKYLSSFSALRQRRIG